MSTNAQVNVVMSDKALVKHLRKDLLEDDSSTPVPTSISDYTALLRKKDLQIEKVILSFMVTFHFLSNSDSLY